MPGRAEELLGASPLLSAYLIVIPKLWAGN